MMEEYMVYLEQFWYYLPYMIYTYVFLTLLPKSLSRIKRYADADYETNRYKFHRCYSPDLCCHTLALADDVTTLAKVKARKPVTRIYPKRNSNTTDSGYPSTSSENGSNGSRSSNTKRPVQTYTHVNQIARMFETGGVSSHNNANTSKKINRVPPTIYPMETIGGGAIKHKYLQHFISPQHVQKKVSPVSLLRPVPIIQHKRRSSAEEFAEMLLAENLLDLQDLELLESCEQVTRSKTISNETECAEALNVPTSWHAESNRLTRGGTSATPSTASPAASSSPMSASPPASPRQLSPAPAAIKSSLDDIFAAIVQSAEKSELQFMCSADAAATLLPPVTSIDDILSQRRLSRPLSAYSISDLLLNEENSKLLTTEP